MNIYEKLQDARVTLQGASLKKTGKNDYAGYDYFELGDFLPKINELLKEHKLTSVVCFTNEIASLTIINSEKPDEQMIFTSPMSEAQIKGCLAVQNLGAVQTYLRRYLYMNAFEIVEHDAVDGLTGVDDKNQNKNKNLSEKQVNRLFAIAKSKGYDNEAVKKTVLKKYGVTEIASLSKTQYDEAVKGFENAKEKA